MRTSSLLSPLSLYAILLVAIASLASSACDDTPEPAPGVFVGPAPRDDLPGRHASTDAGTDAPLGAMIGGRIETDDGQPIIGRPIAVVDARGERREILSDEGGGFHVPDVVKPYDLAIAGSPSSGVRTPTVYLGITREDPFVELFERDGPTTRPASQKLRFAVKAPPCSTPSCTIAVSSGSRTGSGACAVTYRRESVVQFELEHEWSTLMIGANETIDLHVLTFDESRTKFTYANRDGIRAAFGDLTELGILEPSAVPSSDPLVVSAVARGPSAAWTPTIATWLDLPGHASLSFSYDASRDETLRLPLVHGASLRANAWMQHPAVGDRPQFHSAAQAWSGSKPIVATGGVLALDLPPSPVPVRPEMDGQLSAGGLGIAWTNPPSAPMPLTEITIARVDTGALRYRVWTIGDEIPFARLRALGIQPLTPGDHVIGITSSPIDALDDVVHPDALVRHSRFDPRRRGSASYQRFQFQVTK